MSFALGPLRLDSNLFLSPLAGYTNLPFRLTIRELGGVGLCTTDLVNARALIEQNRKSKKLIETCAADTPLSVQLYGNQPEVMRDAALLLESLGYAAVDVNMGCPVRKVCATGGGAALMSDLRPTAAMVRAMVEAVRIPVTCKMRLGWDDENLTAPDLARALEDVGVAALIVHGRTRAQGFNGRVQLDGIRRVVAAVQQTPVVGNGDVTSPPTAKRMLDETGCAAVAIGRGAFYNPWLFCQTKHYLATGQLLPDPGFDERLALMTRHLDRMVEVFGDDRGCQMFRKVGPQYVKHCGPAIEFNRRVKQLRTRAEFDEILAAFGAWRRQFLDDAGELLPPFRPRSTGGSLIDDSDEPALRVNSGPNELW